MSYYDNEELLKYFSRVIKEEAKKKINQLEKEIADIKARQLKQIDDELQNSIYKTMNLKIEEITSEHNASINKLKIENHKSIMQKRTELLDSVISDVKKKCLKYVKTKEYEKEMEDKVAKIKADFKGCEIEFRVNASDETLKKILKIQCTDRCNIINDENIEIGGFIVICPSKKVLSNETIDAKIDEQRQWFHEHTNLAIS